MTLAVVQPEVAVFPVADNSVDLDVVRLVAEGLRRLDRRATALIVLTRDARLVGAVEADQKWRLHEGRLTGRVRADDDDVTPTA